MSHTKNRRAIFLKIPCIFIEKWDMPFLIVTSQKSARNFLIKILCIFIEKWDIKDSLVLYRKMGNAIQHFCIRIRRLVNFMYLWMWNKIASLDRWNSSHSKYSLLLYRKMGYAIKHFGISIRIIARLCKDYLWYA